MSQIPVRIGLAAAFFTALALAWLSFRALSAQRLATGAVQHSLQVELETEKLLDAVADAETGQRGYLLTGDASYLEPYHAGRRAAVMRLEQLRTLTSDNSQERAILEQLGIDLQTKLDELDRTVALNRQGAHAEAQTIVLSNLGKQAMDRLRNDLASIEQTENEELAHRGQREDRSARAAMLLGVGGSLLLALLVVLAAVIVVRELRARELLAEERAARSEYLSRLIGVLGHDARNPLSTMRLATAMLRAEPDAKPTEFRLKQIGRIDASVTRINHIVQMVLDFTRAQFGLGLPADPEPTEIGPVVDAALDEMRLLHPKLTFERQVEGPGLAYCDRRRVHQALTNLLQNAIAYGAPDKPISVQVSSAAQTLSIRVHNHGAPIAPEALPKLFEPFQRGAQDDTAAHLGLGLFIVREIMRAQNGAVQVRSTADEGTTFELTLPASAPAPESEPAPAASGETAE